ncbi:hypothetical protein M441DRAFT_374739 [Trichoderma asperellum CBS 433.97]|uniref:SGTA homodimerisation domain-containing protein n=1 Tax=Trichoderma asperellum (strain ATCC 204424 / CBS 433.97 / NBRC 101777) TaxID=1042311 RepID=A0A2T3ZFH8_TRIA4|nr:hypothetical protein M441DRAFT_374739 [Trichoderma asperellum CBS 433.97]PTB43562.1 hypothetical protein M441DRAFT_374739 [Trichoderma asperellum CBS 433.97]
MAAQQTPKQRLALAICDFLSTSTTDGTLTAEDKDSIDVFSKYESSNSSSSSAAASASASTPAATSASTSSPASSTPEPSDAQKKEAESLKSKGNAAMAQKDYASAIDLYTQALALHPSNAVFLSNRAAAHSAARDHQSFVIKGHSSRVPVWHHSCMPNKTNRNKRPTSSFRYDYQAQ